MRTTMKKSRAARAQALPNRLRGFFWEHAFDALSWPEDRDLVVARILSAGDWDAVRWLRRRLGDAALRCWLVERKGAGLDARRLRFWQLVLDLPDRTVSRWLRSEARRAWDGRLGR